MTYISDLLKSLLEHNRSAELAENEFRKLMAEDENLKENYSEWCETLGYDIKTGFIDYMDELIEMRADIWDSLNEYEDSE